MKEKAITLELDPEGFYLLNSLGKASSITSLKSDLKKTFHRSFLNSEIKEILNCFSREGFINKSNFSKLRHKDARKTAFISKAALSAPETVHLSITGQCNLNCPFCYGKNQDADLTTTQLLALIDELSSLKVFQLAIGGGEPFLRKDIFEIIDYCQQKGIVANITTNGTLNLKEIAPKIKNKVGQVNLSYNECVNPERIKNSLNVLIQNNIKVGINLLVTKSLLLKLDKILPALLKYKITAITILRPKPGQNREWHHQNKLTKEELLKLKKILDQYHQINVDCSLVCLMWGIPKSKLQEKAVYGCVAGIRFCTIKNNGDVFPCSFFNSEEFLAGNILTSSFKSIWRNAETFKKFREISPNIKGNCGSCAIKEHCWGCRRIAWEAGSLYEEEKECPGVI